MNKRHLAILLAIIVILSLPLAACGGLSSSDAPAGDAAAGQETYTSLPCLGCHGDNAEGSLGPKLAGFSEGWDKYETVVRNGEEAMPKFGTDVVSDQQLADMYAWFISTK